MSEQIELKPCPFHQWHEELQVLAVNGVFQGECSCGARGPVGETRGNAVAAWNRRAPSEQPSGEMSLSRAVEVLNEYKHSETDQWKIAGGIVVAKAKFLLTGEYALQSCTPFEAWAIARAYLRDSESDMLEALRLRAELDPGAPDAIVVPAPPEAKPELPYAGGLEVDNTPGNVAHKTLSDYQRQLETETETETETRAKGWTEISMAELRRRAFLKHFSLGDLFAIYAKDFVQATKGPFTLAAEHYTKHPRAGIFCTGDPSVFGQMGNHHFVGESLTFRGKSMVKIRESSLLPIRRGPRPDILTIDDFDYDKPLESN